MYVFQSQCIDKMQLFYTYIHKTFNLLNSILNLAAEGRGGEYAVPKASISAANVIFPRPVDSTCNA